MAMSQIDFYILPERSSREHFACVLVQKVWRQGHNIFINTSSALAAEELDQLLWTFKDISFLPHTILADQDVEDVPIIIGHDNQPDNLIPQQIAIMLNLTSAVPKRLDEKITRVLEIVAGNEADRQQARRRYTDYRDQGHILHRHKIESHYA